MSHPHAATGRILVVDDETSVREILRDFLALEGFDVVTADNGRAALVKLLREPIDLVLTDLEMPEMSGLDLLREIKQLRQRPAAIMMTGYGTVESAIEAMKIGAFDYILKPFQIEELSHLVRKTLEHKRLAEENVRLSEAVAFYQVSESLARARSAEEVGEVLAAAIARELEPAVFAALTLNNGAWHTTAAFAVNGGEPRLALGEPSSLPLLKAFRDERTLVLSGAQYEEFFVGGKPLPASAIVVPLRSGDRVMGLAVAAHDDGSRAYTEGDRKTLQFYADRAAATLDNLRLIDDLKQTFMQTIESLVSALDAKDEYTAGHSARVSQWAVIIGELLGLGEDEMLDLRRGSLLHDIGKIGLNMDMLNKPEKLTNEERDRFRLHPVVSKRILEPIEFLKGALPTVLHHHERWDGGGYPLGLKGAQIPLGARILAIADAFEVMITDRVYRAALTLAQTRQELDRNAGSQFDPDIVAAFLAWLERFASVDELPVKGGRRAAASTAAIDAVAAHG